MPVVKIYGASDATTTDLALLRRAVLLDPGSDDARLVFADALDESGGEMLAKWAALIRCQIELARLVNAPWDLTPWLRRGEKCGRCKGKGGWQTGPHSEDCRMCDGLGWLGSLADVPDDRITISRGFVRRVELTADQVQDTGFLARLFTEWPVTEAGLIGKEPHEDNGYFSGPNYRIQTHDWWRNRDDAVCDLPDTLFDEVSKRGWRYDYDDGSSVCEFTTTADAVAALSRAIVSLGREAAGLPQIGEVRK